MFTRNEELSLPTKLVMRLLIRLLEWDNRRRCSRDASWCDGQICKTYHVTCPNQVQERSSTVE